MRALSLLLILGNVLYFIWAQFVDLPPTFTDAQGTAASQTIVLASERSMNGSSAPAPVNDPPADTFAEECVSVGPFPSVAEAARAAATLTAARFEVRQRVEQGELWAGYWVHVPDLGVPGAADSAIQQLRERGVTDVFLMPTDDTPVLSLGVFVDPERAQRRANVARELGLNVRIVDRKRTGSVYWVDAIPVEPGQVLEPSMFPLEPGKIVRIELRPCPQA